MNREEQTYSTNTGEFIAEKLLPCPFCGGEPEFITIGNDYTKSRKAEIKCTNCFVKRTTGAIRNDLEWCGRKAIELWNKRTNGLSLPPAEGAVNFDDIYELLGRGIDKIMRGESSLGALADEAEAFINSEVKKRLEQPTAEGAEEIIESIVESLGEPINIHNHIFEIRPYTVEHKTEWWIFHKEVGSGEPLTQWLSKFATLHAQRIAEKMVSERMEQYKAQFKDRPNPLEVNPYDSKGIKRIRNRKIH